MHIASFPSKLKRNLRRSCRRASRQGYEPLLKINPTLLSLAIGIPRVVA